MIMHNTYDQSSLAWDQLHLEEWNLVRSQYIGGHLFTII